MIHGDLSGLGLFDALNLCEFTLAGGALHVDAPDISGVIHVHDGRLTFAEISGQSTGPGEREAPDIPTGTWQAVIADPGARGAVASALIDRGVDPAAVRRFVRRRIENVVAELALQRHVELAAKPDPGWFGNEIGVPISSVIEAARIINFGGELVGDHTRDALVAPAPTEQATVVLGSDQWNALAELLGATSLEVLRERLGGRRAVELVRFLQSRGLATVVTARED